VVSPAQPTLTTLASGPITLNANGAPTISDTADLEGAYFPTGSITFTLTFNGNPVTAATQTDTVTKNGTYNASFTLPTTGTVAGTYLWHAVYTSGDGNNLTASDNGQKESTVVSPASPSISTTANPTSGVAGSTTLNDSAMLSSGYYPGGSITFYLFSPGVTPNATDSNNLYSDTVTVSGNGSYSTATGTNAGGFKLPATAAVGTYQWLAVYSGDGNNNSATSSFGSEPVPVKTAGQIAPTNTTAAQFASGNSSTLSTINCSTDSNGNIAQSINPGVFFYFSFVTANAGDTITVFEVPPTVNSAGKTYNAAPFLVAGTSPGTLELFDSTGTNGVAGGTPVTVNGVQNGAVTFVAPYTGTFVVQVKYSTKTVVGTPSPGLNNSSTYTWTTNDPSNTAQAAASVTLQDPPASFLASNVAGPASLANSPRNSGTSGMGSSLASLPSVSPALSGMAHSLGSNNSSIGSILSAWEATVLGAIEAERAQLFSSLAARDQLFIDWANQELHDLLGMSTAGIMGA
jgi:hypothetical protein